ncbi:MAG: gliding motility-associated C-terminal domain-containing protein, partial [Bacteroidota bacterium]
ASATDTVTQPQMVIPAFGTIGPLCINSIPPPLPLVSLDSITGRWDPPAINTSLIGISSYTFTPDAGQCAVNATVEIMITSEIIPAFAAIGPLCLDSEPPALPGTSLNGITGTWAPAIISTNQTGTFIYTFTPDTAQCATPVTMAIQVSNQIVPQFAGIGPLCQNSISPPLPSTSLNGITGNWNPATINTSDTGTFIYTFLPDPGQCSDSATVAIQVNVQLIPLFAGIGPLCQNSTPPALPETSLNGISGYWTPGTINTAVAGTTTCLFTPDALTCALGFTLEITVTPEMIPDFPAIGPLCQNSQPPVLPGTSSNGITGTWTPPAINTSVTGTMSYTFAPDTGQCAIPITSEITVAAEIMPVFAAIGPLCMNTQPPALPGTSVNGISGKWVPAVINTGIPGTIIYTFTPDAGQCGIVISLAVQVTDQLVPHFEDIGPLCQNSVPPALPAISSEGITGTWNPASISTGDFGSTNYIFTPVNGQCAVTTSLTIEIKGPVISSILTISSTNGLPNGYARIKVQDSLSSSPLTYSLDETHWQNSAEFRGLIAGTYVGWVRDALGCITFRQFVIPNTITGEVGILAGDVLSCISVPIQIPVMAYDFTNIAAFTIQLTYDSTVVAFTGLSQISSLLSDGVLSTSSVSPGVIQFSFVANDSITMYNDGLLFDLNFIGLVSGHTNLEWNWLRCVIYSAAGYELPAIYTMGTIEIRPAPQIFTDGGGTYCEGADAKLSAGSLTGQKLSYNWTSPGGSTYLGQEWDLGKVDTTFTGVYQVTASDSTACSKSEDIAVQVYTNPVIQISDHDTLCSEQEITLNAGPGFAAYLWQDGSTAPQLVAAEEGWYKVIVTDIHGCEGGDSVLLRPCELLLWMPNAFSPNGDDLNDVFGPKYNVDVDIDFHMEIYNKWGERIFVTDDIRKGWDGTFKGKLCPSDMYTWTIRFKAPYTYYFLQKSPQSGNVLLLK